MWSSSPPSHPPQPVSLFPAVCSQGPSKMGLLRPVVLAPAPVLLLMWTSPEEEVSRVRLQGWRSLEGSCPHPAEGPRLEGIGPGPHSLPRASVLLQLFSCLLAPPAPCLAAHLPFCLWSRSCCPGSSDAVSARHPPGQGGPPQT